MGVSRSRGAVRMTDEEWAPVAAFASREGVTLSDAVRILIARGLAAGEPARMS